jgi:hypothetical protein
VADLKGKPFRTFDSLLSSAAAKTRDALKLLLEAMTGQTSFSKSLGEPCQRMLQQLEGRQILLQVYPKVYPNLFF